SVGAGTSFGRRRPWRTRDERPSRLVFAGGSGKGPAGPGRAGRHGVASCVAREESCARPDGESRRRHRDRDPDRRREIRRDGSQDPRALQGGAQGGQVEQGTRRREEEGREGRRTQEGRGEEHTQAGARREEEGREGGPWQGGAGAEVVVQGQRSPQEVAALASARRATRTRRPAEPATGACRQRSSTWPSGRGEVEARLAAAV